MKCPIFELKDIPLAHREVIELAKNKWKYGIRSMPEIKQFHILIHNFVRENFCKKSRQFCDIQNGPKVHIFRNGKRQNIRNENNSNEN